MVIWALLPKVSYVVHKQNKWLYVFNLISHLFNGVSSVPGSPGCGESGVDRTGFSPLCRNSFNIGVFFSDIMKQYVSYSFYVYFNKGQKTGMEGGEGWGMLMKSIHFLSTRFICLNKNSILV